MGALASTVCLVYSSAEQKKLTLEVVHAVCASCSGALRLKADAGFNLFLKVVRELGLVCGDTATARDRCLDCA